MSHCKTCEGLGLEHVEHSGEFCPVYAAGMHYSYSQSEADFQRDSAGLDPRVVAAAIQTFSPPAWAKRLPTSP